MLRVPGLPPRRVTAEVSTASLGPTLLHLAGVAPPPGAEAPSLLPLAAGRPAPPGPPVTSVLFHDPSPPANPP